MKFQFDGKRHCGNTITRSWWQIRSYFVKRDIEKGQAPIYIGKSEKLWNSSFVEREVMKSQSPMYVGRPKDYEIPIFVERVIMEKNNYPVMLINQKRLWNSDFWKKDIVEKQSLSYNHKSVMIIKSFMIIKKEMVMKSWFLDRDRVEANNPLILAETKWKYCVMMTSS